MNHPFINFLVRCVVLALGVFLAAEIIPGIAYRDGRTLLIVVLVLAILNAILKPLLLLFTLPFIVLTLGLGVLVINAILFLFAGRLVDGFHVSGFWAAVGGSIIVSLTNVLLSRFLGPPPNRKPPAPPAGAARVPAKRDDVIDI